MKGTRCKFCYVKLYIQLSISKFTVSFYIYCFKKNVAFWKAIILYFTHCVLHRHRGVVVSTTASQQIGAGFESAGWSLHVLSGYFHFLPQYKDKHVKFS